MRVLVVEADPQVRRSLTYALLELGCEVSATGNARAALDTLAVVHPDAILLDGDLPGMDASEFLAEQRRRPGVAAIPVLVATGAPGAGSGDFPGAGVVLKPVSAEELLTALRFITGEAGERPAPRAGGDGVPDLVDGR